MRPRNLLRVALVACLILVVPLSLVSAQEGGTLQRILSQGYMTVGVSGTFPPFGIVDKSTGKVSGFDIDIARIIAFATWFEGKTYEEVQDKLDSKLKFVIEPEASRIPNLLSGTVDVVIQGMTETPSRAQVVEFTRPYYIEHGGLIAKKGTAVPKKSYAELVGTKPKIAVLQNPFAEMMAKRFAKDAVVLQFPNTSDALLAVETGHAKYMSADWSTIAYIMKQDPGKWVRGPRAADINRQNYALAVKPGDQRWLNYLNLVLTEMMTGILRDQYVKAYQDWFFEAPEWGYPDNVSPEALK